jgi:hypothetical protein
MGHAGNMGLANGAWSESFQPGTHSQAGLAVARRDALFHLIPDLRAPGGTASFNAARRTLRRHEARLLVG